MLWGKNTYHASKSLTLQTQLYRTLALMMMTVVNFYSIGFLLSPCSNPQRLNAKTHAKCLPKVPISTTVKDFDLSFYFKALLFHKK